MSAAPETIFQEFASDVKAHEYYEEHNRQRNEVSEEKLRPLIEDFQRGDVDIVEFKS